jgi:hypothetical protein
LVITLGPPRARNRRSELGSERGTSLYALKRMDGALPNIILDPSRYEADARLIRPLE